MISSYRCKEVFLAMRMHFTQTEYDYFKYNGRLRKQPTETKYEFEKLVRKYSSVEEVEKYFLANMANQYIETSNISTYIGDYVLKRNEEIYNRWIGVRLTFNRNFFNYVQSKENLIELLKQGKSLPRIIEDSISKKIPIEYVLAILKFYPSIIQRWNERYSSNPYFLDLMFFMKKYLIFFEKYFNMEKIGNGMKNL